ncbi:MAG: guanylate kinase, partial [Clostridiales bacterium]|nr:guanylate kinase [Clostridiales bacterium]
MGKIFYLMGPSSSGKDTIYKRLLGEKELELHTLVTYTTRPIRVGETEGVEYHFTDEE